MIDPTTGQPGVFSVTTQVNGPSAQVRGVELALQHVFGDSGFGLQANATFVDTDKPYDEHDISVSGFAVTGLATRPTWSPSTRSTASTCASRPIGVTSIWTTSASSRTTRRSAPNPSLSMPTLQVDLSTSYDFDDRFSVFFEAPNLNNRLQHARPVR